MSVQMSVAGFSETAMENGSWWALGIIACIVYAAFKLLKLFIAYFIGPSAVFGVFCWAVAATPYIIHCTRLKSCMDDRSAADMGLCSLKDDKEAILDRSISDRPRLMNNVMNRTWTPDCPRHGFEFTENDQIGPRTSIPPTKVYSSCMR